VNERERFDLPGDEEWERFLEKLPASSPVRPAIAESWARCRAQDAGTASSTTRVSDAELQSRRQAADVLMDIARTHLDWLSSSMPQIDHVAYIADRDGIVLYVVGDPQLAEDFDVQPGSDVSEKAAGTNGAGTALVVGRPFAVVGSEHYLNRLAHFTCTAAPIRDENEIIGAINVSTSVLDATPERVVVVAHVANVIERELAYRREPARLRDADRRKNEFLAILAHELRNPLAAMQNAHALLRSAQSHPEILERAHETLNRQLTSLTRLIEDLLDVARIAHDKIALSRGRIELGAVVREAVEMNHPAIQKKHQHITVLEAASDLMVDGDSMRLTQVFVNLLSNANKYTPANGSITVTLEKRDDRAVVSIADTGTGIPPERLDSIFDLFVQVDRSIAESHAGLGIGLTLVKRLVELHGGVVHANSGGKGKGSCFTVSLPLIR